jgi:hypothetical protein
MKRTWQDRLIDWMNGLSLRIEMHNARRRLRTEIQCELIHMDAEDKIRRYEEAARRVARRRETCAFPPNSA